MDGGQGAMDSMISGVVSILRYFSSKITLINHFYELYSSINAIKPFVYLVLVYFTITSSAAPGGNHAGLSPARTMKTEENPEVARHRAPVACEFS